jgi:hypothetical protein
VPRAQTAIVEHGLDHRQRPGNRSLHDDAARGVELGRDVEQLVAVPDQPHAVARGPDRSLEEHRRQCVFQELSPGAGDPSRGTRQSKLVQRCRLGDLVLDAKEAGERRHGQRHSKLVDAGSIAGQQCNLFLGGQQHIVSPGPEDFDSRVEPAQRIDPEGRNAVDPAHVAGEAGQP